MPKRTVAPSLLLSWKYPSALLVTSGILFWDQIRRVKKKIDLSTTAKAWTRAALEPEFIYINDAKNEDLLQKFEISGLTSELYKITQLYLWLSGKFRGSQLYEDIFSFHQNLAWRFLRLAQDENYYYRRHAVQTLAQMPSLSDATCRQLAQASDQRTAVGLARSEGANLRLLLDPPGWHQPLDQNAVLRRLHKFLLALDADAPHPCLQYVIAQAFAERDHKGFDDDVGFNKSQPDIVPKCADAILHHSWLGSNARSIVAHGGLPLIVDIYRILEAQPEKLDTLIVVSRLLSNLSMHPDFHKQLHMSGCIKILASLLQHADLRVSIPAGRALLNCDVDASPPGEPGFRFLRNVYALHPIHRAAQRSHKADVVFVHGLLGGVFVTWRQRDGELVQTSFNEKDDGNGQNGLFADWSDTPMRSEDVKVTDFPIDANVEPSTLYPQLGKVQHRKWERDRTQCWPRDWLARDCPELRVLGVNYDTNITMWAPMCPIAPNRLTLSDRSEHLIKVLLEAGLGTRPIVWVAHSMGGLIVKDLLVKCSESGDVSKRALVDQTQGVVFFSTPHRGSRLATMSPTSQMIVWPTIEVQELRQNSPALLELHDKFVRLAAAYPVRVLSFAERQATCVKALKMDLRFVEDASSCADVGELYGVPLDHLCVCKPAIRESFLYQKVLHFIEEIISKTGQR